MELNSFPWRVDIFNFPYDIQYESKLFVCFEVECFHNQYNINNNVFLLNVLSLLPLPV